MLIHGRLLVTEHGFMLDEVKSLLQKSLRRKETELIRKAAKELVCGAKDQLQWKGIVTYIFEDHCLSHVRLLVKLYQLYVSKNKLGCIDLISQCCYTCRYSACLQVVAIREENRKYADFWDCKTPVDPDLRGLVVKKKGSINCERLLTFIVKFWQQKDTGVLTSLFGLVNMAAKVEGRQLTKAGIAKLLDPAVKKPSLFHLVLSVVYRCTDTADVYMRRLIRICFKFTSIPEVSQGLIMFTVLTQKIHQAVIEGKHGDRCGDVASPTKWNTVGVLSEMPDWAVDKHTYRGKFGKSSAELFKKKFKEFSFGDAQLDEFHGERPKVGIPHFFDVGCICNNDILPDNPIWEKTKELYLKQTKKSLQKTAKMTQFFYDEMRSQKSVVLYPTDAHAADTSDDSETQGSVSIDNVVTQTLKRRACSVDTIEQSKKLKLARNKAIPSKLTIKPRRPTKQVTFSDSVATMTGDVSTSTSENGMHSSQHEGSDVPEIQTPKQPRGPLLQLPTGSGKVYTVLDEETKKVWKGPYKTKERMNLCVFYHRAMKEIFQDKHTLDFTVQGSYIIFPLIMSASGRIHVTNRPFYDCIARKSVPVEDGQFVERESLGIVQLHKVSKDIIKILPLSIWAHFAYRYVLNIGDTGLYNAIATRDDISLIYGIDMEERRNQVKGNDVINMMFGKLPRKEIIEAIKEVLCEGVDELYDLLDRKVEAQKLSAMYREYGLNDDSEVCMTRLAGVKQALETHCRLTVGV